MKINCLCVMFYDVARIKKGKFETKDRLITCRVRLFEKVTIIVPEGVQGYPVDRKRLLFLVDLQKLVAVPKGNVTIEDKELTTKLDLLMRNKFWKFLGGRGLDTIELLITMGAGYGFLRLVEVLITMVFAK